MRAPKPWLSAITGWWSRHRRRWRRRHFHAVKGGATRIEVALREAHPVPRQARVLQAVGGRRSALAEDRWRKHRDEDPDLS